MRNLPRPGVVIAGLEVVEAGGVVFFVAGEAEGVGASSGLGAGVAPGVVLVAGLEGAVGFGEVDDGALRVEEIILLAFAAVVEADQLVGAVGVFGERGAGGVGLEQDAVAVVAVAPRAAGVGLAGAQALVVVTVGAECDGAFAYGEELIAHVVEEGGADAALALEHGVAVGIVLVDDVVGGIEVVGDAGELVAGVVGVGLAHQRGGGGGVDGRFGQAVEGGVAHHSKSGVARGNQAHQQHRF